MALSNSVNFTMTASELIENSFSKIGIKKMEQPLLAPELQDGLDNLNLMMKAWQAQGLHLWSMEEGVCFLDSGVTCHIVQIFGSFRVDAPVKSRHSGENRSPDDL